MHGVKRQLAFIFALAWASNAHAVRWFEVEIIAFEQKSSPLLREDFSLEHKPIEGKKQRNLLTEGFNSQGQQLCLQGDSFFDPRPLSVKLTHKNASWLCEDNADYLSKFDTLPLTPYAPSQEHMDNIYLLAKEQLQFDSTLTKLKRKGLKPLLHTGWRFPEQSKRRAPFIKIFAGKRFKEPVSYRISEAITQQGYVSLLPAVPTAQPNVSQDSWQIEGLIKIHVRHYLYVTTELDIRYDIDNGDTQTARMSQYTRVYSGDVHYLDHPKLGIIFQIRKYKH
ncbi:hypothetical protein PCIT_a4190 [Pseudoalteromonas citrea]|uniref:DUF2490 domain-containing protein n=2 Tax=Pseudoalteromonas citrea TaxID=43655 RepID=A0AAD4FRV7_9GAMM|nr:CsiV family protein [Pseudoalteromonas citrea]KAF7771142.1 hypothetical protein PCIT_a4190 [Pseudoalteromonas citrea]